MCEFTDEERKALTATRSITRDEEYARIEAIGIEHTLEMPNPPWR